MQTRQFFTHLNKLLPVMKVPGNVGGNEAYLNEKELYVILFKYHFRFASIIHVLGLGMRPGYWGATTGTCFHRWRKLMTGCAMVTPGRRLDPSTCARSTSTAAWSTQMKEWNGWIHRLEEHTFNYSNKAHRLFGDHLICASGGAGSSLRHPSAWLQKQHS